MPANNPVAGVAVTFAPGNERRHGHWCEPDDRCDRHRRRRQLDPWQDCGTVHAHGDVARADRSPLTFTATGVAGAPATLAKFSGDNLTGQVGSTLATPHNVLVTDANGNPVGSVTVTWAPASGGGSVSPTSSLTDVTATPPPLGLSADAGHPDHHRRRDGSPDRDVHGHGERGGGHADGGERR